MTGDPQNLTPSFSPVQSQDGGPPLSTVGNHMQNCERWVYDEGCLVIPGLGTEESQKNDRKAVHLPPLSRIRK